MRGLLWFYEDLRISLIPLAVIFEKRIVTGFEKLVFVKYQQSRVALKSDLGRGKPLSLGNQHSVMRMASLCVWEKWLFVALNAKKTFR